MTFGLGGNGEIECVIKDVSYPDLTMYRVNFSHVGTDRLRKEIDEFINENYPDHDCLSMGFDYLLMNVDCMDMALKLRF